VNVKAGPPCPNSGISHRKLVLVSGAKWPEEEPWWGSFGILHHVLRLWDVRTEVVCWSGGVGGISEPP
jgi:hypothetical protein